MAGIGKAGALSLGDLSVHRMGYGAMQLAGPGVFGPPKDRDTALTVLRQAVESGIDHIDTSDGGGARHPRRMNASASPLQTRA